MTIECPSCRSPVATVSDSAEVVCTACGSSFRVGESTATAQWSPERRTIGKFELLEQVGAGSFGVVYKAKDTELGRTVAVKVPRSVDHLDPADNQRFLREARSVAQLRHPTIVPVFEIGQESGRPFLVSEFIQGITLADLLTSERLEFQSAAELIAELGEALHYAHQQGVVHRDVKPSNVMLERIDPQAGARRYATRLMDFGLAKRENVDATMTVDGQVLGTPAYMSPEQARGESRGVDGRSDVYSLGVILYQLLTGDLPFKGNTRMLLHQVLNEEPYPPRQRDAKIPRDLETVCLKAMAKEPSRRYQSAGEFAVDLRRFLADQPILARRTTAVERLSRWVRRNPALAGLSTLVGCLVVLLVVVAIGKQRAKEQVNALPTLEQQKEESSSDELLELVAEIDRTDPGWRLAQLEARRPKIASEKDGGYQVEAFRKAVADFTQRPKSEGDWLRYEWSNRQAYFEELPPLHRLSPAEAAELKIELLRVEKLLIVARQMRVFPTGRLSIAYTRDAVGTLLPLQQTVRHLVRLLQLHILATLHEGNQRQAFDDAVSIFHCCSLFDGEPIAISQLVRIAAFGIGVRSLERLLAVGSLSDRELSQLFEQVRKEEQSPVQLTMARGERAMLHNFFGSLAAGDSDVKEMLKAFGATEEFRTPSSAEIRRSHAWSLSFASETVRIAGEPIERQRLLFEELERMRASDPRAHSPLSQLFLMNQSSAADEPETSIAAASAQAAWRHRALARTTLTALAIEQYRLRRGQWPRDLAELVPESFSAIPIDPYDGNPLRFRRTPGGVVVYSVGPNLQDDQGLLYRSGAMYKDKKYLPQDIGFQLFNLDKRVAARKN